MRNVLNSSHSRAGFAAV